MVQLQRRLSRIKTHFETTCHILVYTRDPRTKTGDDYIDVGDGCWRRNVLVTTWSCWRLENCHQHPLAVRRSLVAALDSRLSLTVTPTKTDKVDSISLIKKIKGAMFLTIFPITINLIFLVNLTNRFSEGYPRGMTRRARISWTAVVRVQRSSGSLEMLTLLNEINVQDKVKYFCPSIG